MFLLRQVNQSQTEYSEIANYKSEKYLDFFATQNSLMRFLWLNIHGICSAHAEKNLKFNW